LHIFSFDITTKLTWLALETLTWRIAAHHLVHPVCFSLVPMILISPGRTVVRQDLEAQAMPPENDDEAHAAE
jgi:hypothetical protein